MNERHTSAFLFGFYSEDLILEFLYTCEVEMFLIFIMLISLPSTVIRHFIPLFIYKRNKTYGMFPENKFIDFSRHLLAIMIIIQ